MFTLCTQNEIHQYMYINSFYTLYCTFLVFLENNLILNPSIGKFKVQVNSYQTCTRLCFKTKSTRRHSSLPCGGFGFPLYAQRPHVTSKRAPHWLKQGFQRGEASCWTCSLPKGGDRKGVKRGWSLFMMYQTLCE